MSKKMGNAFGATEGAHPVQVPTPLSSSAGSVSRAGGLGSAVHTPTPSAGAMPSRGSYKPSGMEQAMGAHADKLHPVGKPAGRTSARMMGESTHDRKASGGF